MFYILSFVGPRAGARTLPIQAMYRLLNGMAFQLIGTLVLQIRGLLHSAVSLQS